MLRIKTFSHLVWQEVLAAVRQSVARQVLAHAEVVVGRGEEGGRRAVELFVLLAAVAVSQVLVRGKHQVHVGVGVPASQVHLKRRNFILKILLFIYTQHLTFHVHSRQINVLVLLYMLYTVPKSTEKAD